MSVLITSKIGNFAVYIREVFCAREGKNLYEVTENKKIFHTESRAIRYARNVLKRNRKKFIQEQKQIRIKRIRKF